MQKQGIGFGGLQYMVIDDKAACYGQIRGQRQVLQID